MNNIFGFSLIALMQNLHFARCGFEAIFSGMNCRHTSGSCLFAFLDMHFRSKTIRG